MKAPPLSNDLVAGLEAAIGRARREAPDLADELEVALDCYLARRIAFHVPGQPQPQGRARGSVRFRDTLDPVTREPKARAFVKMRDPERSAAWKQSAAWLLWGAMPSPRAALEGPVAVRVRAVFARLKADQVDGRAWHTHPKGDADNVAKAVLDALNAHAFRDDRQVARLVVEKLIAAPGESPGVAVELAPLGAIPAPTWRK